MEIDGGEERAVNLSHYSAAALVWAARLSERIGTPIHVLHTDVLQNLKRIFYFAKRMARAAIPTVELREEN